MRAAIDAGAVDVDAGLFLLVVDGAAANYNRQLSAVTTEPNNACAQAIQIPYQGSSRVAD